MHPQFWLQRWETDRIGFHERAPNNALVDHVDKLTLEWGSRFFVPLCGKTLDIGWLLAKGFRVVGAELSELAVEQLFAELGVIPEVIEREALAHYSAGDLDIFVGDIFDVQADLLGPVDAIYDRAALVALPEVMRDRYTAHLRKITDTAPQLLLSFEYDQLAMEGPPFSINRQEVLRHYEESYDITLLESKPVPGGLKKVTPADEHIWLLNRT